MLEFFKKGLDFFFLWYTIRIAFQPLKDESKSHWAVAFFIINFSVEYVTTFMYLSLIGFNDIVAQIDP